VDTECPGGKQDEPDRQQRIVGKNHYLTNGPGIPLAERADPVALEAGGEEDRRDRRDDPDSAVHG